MSFHPVILATAQAAPGAKLNTLTNFNSHCGHHEETLPLELPNHLCTIGLVKLNQFFSSILGRCGGCFAQIVRGTALCRTTPPRCFHVGALIWVASTDFSGKTSCAVARTTNHENSRADRKPFTFNAYSGYFHSSASYRDLHNYPRNCLALSYLHVVRAPSHRLRCRNM